MQQGPTPTPNAAGEASEAAGASGALRGSGGVPPTVGAAGDSVGAAGDSSDAQCDSGCLDSVVSQTSDFGMSWKSSWFLMGCKEKRGQECLTALPAPCSDDNSVPFEDRGATTLETFPIGGVPGQRYKVTFTFNAIAS